MTLGVADPAPLSCVPGIEWPALPTAAGAAMLAMQFQLEQSQWWTREQLVAHQFRQLQELDPTAASPGSFSQRPILTKTSLVQSSVHAQLSEAAAAIARALLVRNLLWHGLDLGGKMAAIHPGLEQRRLANWDAVLAEAFRTGPAVTLGAGTDIDRQLDWLLAERPDYLQTRPSQLRALLRRSQETGRVPPSLRAVLLQGEAFARDLRALAHELWAVPIIHTYGSEETGALALQCPEHEHYHVQSESVYVELLREDGSACPRGEAGRVVVTSLHSFAVPLLRYDVGDRAEFGDACPCGRGLPTLARVRSTEDG